MAVYLCKSDALSIEGDGNGHTHMYTHMYTNKYIHRHIYCIHTHIYTYGNPPAIQETWVPTQGQEDALAKEMATHSSILAWRSPWTEEPGGLQSMLSQELDMT